MNHKYPTVSIFNFCRNSVSTIQRSIESILAQDYPNIEYIVQDGASTDGTLEILKSYGDKIKLISEPDSGPAEAFFTALKRCKGEFIGSCLSDEELFPNAVSWAVENLQKYPDTGAIYGDICSTEMAGKIIQFIKGPDPFVYEQYVCNEVSLPFAASFFRRSCLQAIGLYDHEWALDTGEFELWLKLASHFPVRYIPGTIAKYAVHEKQLSLQTSSNHMLLAGRTKILNQLFNDPQTPPAIRGLKSKSFAGLHLTIAYNFILIKEYAAALEQTRQALQYQPDLQKLFEVVKQLCDHGAQLLQSGSPQEAIDFLNLAAEANFDIPNLQFARGLAFYQLNRFDEARLAAEAELARRPQHEGAKNLLNVTFVSSTPIITPIPDQKASEGNIDSALRKVNDLIDQKKFIESQEALKDIINVDPGNPALIVKLGYIFLQTGDIESARREFVKATVLNPNYEPGHAMLGLLLIYEERYAEAEKALRKARALDPNDVNVKNLLMELESKMQSPAQTRLDSAKESLESILPPQIYNDNLYKTIYEIVRNNDLKTILEIGSSAGEGSTQAIVSAIQGKTVKPTLYCMEISKTRFTKLQERYKNLDYVKCFQASSVPLEEFPDEKMVVDFYRNHQTIINQYSLEEVLTWIRNDINYLRTSGVPITNGIEYIEKQYSLEFFDMVLIDGSEFLGQAELKHVINSRFILLDDTNSYKNYDSRETLLKNKNYKLIAGTQEDRNGWAVFERVSPVSAQVSSYVPCLSVTMIVFNAELLLEACIDSVYDFAHEILIVEGSCPQARWDATPQGTSRDRTLEIITNFPDPQKKIRLIASRAWNHKDEMVNAYIPYVTGDYIFEVDSDEIWSKGSLLGLRQVLQADPTITCLEFQPYHFWHNFETVLTEGHWVTPFMRIFKFEAGSRWKSHEPPILLSPQGIPYNNIKRVNATQEYGITFYHYNYLTEEQASWKAKFFALYVDPRTIPSSDESTEIGMTRDWYEKVWLAWKSDPQGVEARYGTSPGGGPAWRPQGRTALYPGAHPEVIYRHPLWSDPHCHRWGANILEVPKTSVPTAEQVVAPGRPLQAWESWESQPEEDLDNFFRSQGPGQDWTHPSRIKTRELIKELIRKQGKVNILEIGCGPAVEYEGMKRDGLAVDYTGLDITPKMLKISKRRFPEAKFIWGDAKNLDFPDGTFDIVMIRHVLEHLPDYEDTIREMYRVAKKMVIVIFFLPPRDAPDSIQLNQISSGTYYENHYDRRRWIRTLQALQPSVARMDVFDKLDRVSTDVLYAIYKPEELTESVGKIPIRTPAVTAAKNVKTLHLIYSGNPLNDSSRKAPETITNHLYRYFEKRLNVNYIDWLSKDPVNVGDNDVVLGHPDYDPNTPIQRIFRESRCRKKFLIFPFHHGLPDINMPFDPLVMQCTRLFSITGEYWYDTIDKSPFAHWKEKMIPVDMAIDTRFFPFLKHHFNPSGQRVLFYISQQETPEKGIPQLANLVRQTNSRLVIAGNINQTRSLFNGLDVTFLGFIKLDEDRLQWIAEYCDFFINTSVSDANPTTILEMASIGLPVICTPQSGYVRGDLVYSLRLNNVEQNNMVMDVLQHTSEANLFQFTTNARRVVEHEYTWDKFCRTLGNGLESYL